MEVSDSFVPTAGAVGLLPMVTYFFMVVAMFVFLGIFIVAKACKNNQSADQLVSAVTLTLNLLAIAAASTGLVYYMIRSNYHDLLAELPTVSDAIDRQTLFRESYNAIGQYRYMAWFVSAPILLMLTLSPLRLPWESSKRLLVSLFVASLLMVFTGFIGHQQLSFDNEIQIGPKLGWGIISALCYGYIIVTLYRLGKNSSQANRYFRAMALFFASSWGIYIACYLLTFSTIDFTWIHLVLTLTDFVSQAGVGLLAYLNWSDNRIAG